jgi:hypothetical protein
MATNTYVALATVTASGGNNTQLVMSSIPNTYTDLMLVMTGGLNASNNCYIQFNGDTANTYSYTYIYGDGTSASSSRGANQQTLLNYIGTGQTTTIVSINNYSNSTTYKTVLSRGNDASIGTMASVSLWRNTAAINSITIKAGPSGTFNSGTTFSLYGIRAEGTSPAPKATGGAIYSDSTYYYHVFGSTGTFTPLSSLTADVLVVAGGGGGGAYGGGGGGAGGFRALTSQSLTTTAYTCTIGAGGAAGVYNSSQAVNGVNSSFSGSGFSTITADGGGYAGAYPTGTYAGGTGGSGGGSWATTGAAGNSGSYSPVEGYAGGNGAAGGSYNETSGGGGGAGGVGGNATSVSRGGDGGVGNSATFNTWGLATGLGQNVSGTYYIAGGGGAGQPGNITAGAQALGGYGGGGTGSTKSGVVSTAGLANTGGGGGGGSYSGTPGSIYAASAGGSGVVIVRYAKV